MLVVLVNGLPGAGKTTLARALGRELGLPVFTKDAVKETLADHLPGDISPEWSRALGVAAGETLWTLLAYSIDTSRPVDVGALAKLLRAALAPSAASAGALAQPPP